MVEVVGYLVVVVGALLGQLDVAFLLLFVALSMAYGVALSVSAIVMDDARSVQSHGLLDVSRLLLCTVVENFGYRQLLALWRFAAMIEIVAGRKARWDPLQRKGFQTE